MNREILQIAAASLLALFCVSAVDASSADNEVAMVKCSRAVRPSEEAVGPYDEEYSDGTGYGDDDSDDSYGDGDGAPEAENQSQSWYAPVYAEPEYYIPDTAASEPVAEPVKEDRKGAAQKAVDKENAFSVSNTQE